MTSLINKKITDLIVKLANNTISKNQFFETLREEILNEMPNRNIRLVDTSDTRRTSQIVHIPILFVDLDKTNDKVGYVILINADQIASTGTLTPELFVATLSWQLTNIDTITRELLEHLGFEDYTDINPDLSTVLTHYLEAYLKLLVALREQHQKEFAFALVGGVVANPFEIEILIDKLRFNKYVDFDTEIYEVLGSKYHLPLEYMKYVHRVYNSYIEFIKNKQETI